MEAYFDNSATTRVFDSVKDIVVKTMTEDYGNAAAKHTKGVEAERYIREARSIIAKSLKVEEKEIVFTSGGSESNNMALIGTAMANQRGGKHIITTNVEHSSVYNTLGFLQDQGFDITYLPVDSNGHISISQLRESLRPETILVSVMYVNNEVGSVEPIEDIGKVIKEEQPQALFHVDAIQAYGKYQIYPKRLGIDLLSVSCHKLHGPKGVGFLYIRKGVKIRSFIHGGAQERGRRAGTENVPGIVGFGAAVKAAFEGMEEHSAKIQKLRDYLTEKVLNEVPFCRLNGDREKRLPNNINFSFDFIEGESLLMMLDMKGICASSGSACTSGSLDPSHVLLAIGLPHERAHGSLRLTLSEENTLDEMDYVADAIKEIVDRLRQMSPLYEDFIKRRN